MRKGIVALILVLASFATPLPAKAYDGCANAADRRMIINGSNPGVGSGSAWSYHWVTGANAGQYSQFRTAAGFYIHQVWASGTSSWGNWSYYLYNRYDGGFRSYSSYSEAPNKVATFAAVCVGTTPYPPWA